jgi:glycerol kinase
VVAQGVTPLLLGIDEGTTAVKAALYDLDLRPVAAQERRVATTQPRPGWVEQDPLEVLDAVVDAVAVLLDGTGDQVVACGLDHQGESVLAWDAATGRPLTPIVVWQDKRSQEVLDALAPADADEIRRRTGLPLDPYFSAGKLAWLLEHEDLGDDFRLGTVDAFLTDRLGGVFATDPSTASRTQLAVPGAPDWDPWLCERFGVPVEVLPPIEDTAGELGTLRHERWRQDLPLAARAVDQQAALAGAGCVEPGRVKATYGTGVFVLAHAGDEPPAVPGLLPTVAWRVAGRTEYALDGGVFSAGSLLEWLAHDLSLADDVPALVAHAGAVDGAGGVRVLPALAGLGAPWWRPEATALVAGLDGSTRPGHIARAALEAIAWRVADIVAALDADVLRVDGGLTRSDLLLRLQADRAGVPVERGLVDATAAGAAALAAVGAGRWASTRDIADRIPRGDRVEPSTDDAWRARGHDAWRRFVEQALALG